MCEKTGFQRYVVGYKHKSADIGSDRNQLFKGTCTKCYRALLWVRSMSKCSVKNCLSNKADISINCSEFGPTEQTQAWVRFIGKEGFKPSSYIQGYVRSIFYSEFTICNKDGAAMESWRRKHFLLLMNLNQVIRFIIFKYLHTCLRVEKKIAFF